MKICQMVGISLSALSGTQSIRWFYSKFYETFRADNFINSFFPSQVMPNTTLLSYKKKKKKEKAFKTSKQKPPKQKNLPGE